MLAMEITGEKTTMTEQAKPQACVYCKKSLDAYFEIRHFSRAGEPGPREVRVCSLLCLIQWASNYGVRRGLQGVSMIKQLLSNLKG